MRKMWSSWPEKPELERYKEKYPHNFQQWREGGMDYHLLSTYYEPELVWSTLCVFDHEVFTLFLKIYTMRELKDREVMEFLWDPRATEELGKSLYLNFYNFTLIYYVSDQAESVWPHVVGIEEDFYMGQGSRQLFSEALCTVLVTEGVWLESRGLRRRCRRNALWASHLFGRMKWMTNGTDSLQMSPTIKCFIKKPDNLVVNSKHPFPSCL